MKRIRKRLLLVPPLSGEHAMAAMPWVRRGRAKSHQKRANPAFTLIESIIVMVILGLSLAGATYLMMTVTNAIADNRQRITATYLVQECMELTRNVRDSAWKQHLPWDCAFQNTAGKLNDGDAFSLMMDEDSTPKTALGQLQEYCRSNLGLEIEQNPSDFQLKKESVLYQYTQGTETPFARKLRVSEVALDEGGESESAKFTCEVNWESRGNPQQVTMSQILTNWK